MADIQLAIVIGRLYESELDDSMPGSLKRILYEEILGADANKDEYVPGRSHMDPFLRSMSFWLLKDYGSALSTLLQGYENNTTPYSSQEDDLISYAANPSVFNFYNYLRTHPLLIRQHLANTAANKSKSSSAMLHGFSHGRQMSAGDKNITFVDKITPIERRLYFTTAHAHFKAGCPLLALEVLIKLPEVVDVEESMIKSNSSNLESPNTQVNTGTLEDFSKAQREVEKSSDMDWSQPVSNGVKATSDAFDWSQPVSSSLKQNSSDAMDWSKPVSSTADALDWSQPIMSSRFDDDKLDLSFDDDKDTKSDSEIESKDKLGVETPNHESENEAVSGSTAKGDGVKMDIMAQQLKFIACLKIMMEELSTLATGFEVDGGQLRFQLYVWLEREVETIKTLCNYAEDVWATNSAQDQGKT